MKWSFGRKRVKPLRVTREDGFVDLEFGIIKARKYEDLITFEALARHEAQTVGLNVDVRCIGLPRELRPGLLVTPMLVTLRSTGDASDRLLRLLARLFGSSQEPTNMVEHLVLDALSLEGDPTQALHEPVKIKLFHDLELARRREGGPLPEIDDDESYFEWYLNTDPTAETLEFVEKEEEYRETILGVLCGRLGARPWLTPS